MPIRKFPDPKLATPEGILAIGGDLHPQSLQLAYRQGIFPWPIDGLGMAWFHPDPRAILDFKDLRVPKSLKKVQKRQRFSFSIDRAFEQVIRACAEVPRSGQDGTWITPPLRRAFEKFHDLGFAHSVEVWETGDLVGGIYGVAIDGVFSAESMFRHKPNASKLALLFLIEHLRAQGATWMDIQVMTPHMKILGARNISRDAYREKLHATQSRHLTLFETAASR